MTRTDSIVVGTLVALLALIAGLVGLPSMNPAAAPVASPSASTGSAIARPYREGVLGRPVSVSPLSARTQADRDLISLVFSGLVRNGPSGTIVPDLAERWSVDPTGAVWTFQLRADARWHDGEPVTADDVAFTDQGVLQDPKLPRVRAPALERGHGRDLRDPDRGLHAEDPLPADPPGGDQPTPFGP